MRRIAALVGLCWLVVLPAQGQAAYEPLANGVTRLTLDKGFLAHLDKGGVHLSARAGARLKNGIAIFPVSGGKFDPVATIGTVEHGGALVFTAGGRTIPIKFLRLKSTQKRAPLSAKVGGSQLKLGKVGELLVSRDGFATRIKATRLTVSAKLATRLGKKLRRKGIFREGEPLGTAVTVVKPETVTLLGKGNVSLGLDPAFQEKLASLFVAVNPIFPTEHPGVFTLPIAGGEISPDADLGRLETAGAIEFLQQGGGQVFWAESWLDLGAGAIIPEVEIRPSPPYAGKLGPLGVAAVRIVSATATSRTRTVAATGSAALDATTAQTFNEVFAKPQGRDGVFAAGESLGTFSFTAQGQ